MSLDFRLWLIWPLLENQPMSIAFVNHRQALERRIVGMIIQDAIAQGYTVKIDNGEETITAKDLADLMAEIMATDEEALRFFNSLGVYVGSVFLVYGNDGFDCIADHTDNKETRSIIRRAEAYAENAEAEERV
jgi:hypothetical protein